MTQTREHGVLGSRIFAACSVALVVAGTTAAAQDQPPVLTQIDSGKYVRARLDPDRTLSGHFVPVGDGRLGIRHDAGVTDTLRLAEVRELAVRGRHTKAGAILGGIAGVGFGTFVAIMVSALCETDDCRGGRPFAIAIPVFGAGGALVGAAVGTAFPKWKRVYP
ncbi:MAG TPA: hypothetical protein VJ817_10365, partial [Gemmatimonadales bacterium]|nr:hypothetical protein [Gemmatimonadales bacterium]